MAIIRYVRFTFYDGLTLGYALFSILEQFAAKENKAGLSDDFVAV